MNDLFKGQTWIHNRLGGDRFRIVIVDVSGVDVEYQTTAGIRLVMREETLRRFYHRPSKAEA